MPPRTFLELLALLLLLLFVRAKRMAQRRCSHTAVLLGVPLLLMLLSLLLLLLGLLPPKLLRLALRSHAQPLLSATAAALT